MPPTVQDVYDFLTAAATPGSVTRTVLDTGTPNQVKRELAKFGYAAEARVPRRRQVPSIAACQQLLTAAHIDYGAYSPAAPAPESMQLFMMVEGHAMPLMVTVEDEDAAAG
jgi:hypothetical protein